MKEGLPLAWTTGPIPWFAVCYDLSNMPFKSAPSLDLMQVNVRNATPKIVSAIPLEPTSGVGTYNPTLLTP